MFYCEQIKTAKKEIRSPEEKDGGLSGKMELEISCPSSYRVMPKSLFFFPVWSLTGMEKSEDRAHGRGGTALVHLYLQYVCRSEITKFSRPRC